jgi:hypothetical protein
VLDTGWAREDCSQKAGGLRGVEGEEKKRKDGEKEDVQGGEADEE